jgi:predicted transcriptional regulator of viral defense system
MIIGQRSTLSSYAASLLAAGRSVFSQKEAERELGISHGALLDAAERLQSRHQLFSPRRGFYVIVPPQYLSWGAPPPSWYIDDLMRHEKRPYYVGLLKAAELHGATHQAVMEFQVVTDKQLPRIRAGRSIIAFYYRKEMAAVVDGIKDTKTDTGSMKISSVELTALDLLRYQRAAGGIDNIVTVLNDLASGIDPEKLATLSRTTERPVVQRLGHLLTRLGHADRTHAMFDILSQSGTITWTELSPKEAADPALSSQVNERDERWRVVIRRLPEVDE